MLINKVVNTGNQKEDPNLPVTGERKDDVSQDGDSYHPENVYHNDTLLLIVTASSVSIYRKLGDIILTLFR